MEIYTDENGVRYLKGSNSFGDVFVYIGTSYQQNALLSIEQTGENTVRLVSQFAPRLSDAILIAGTAAQVLALIAPPPAPAVPDFPPEQENADG